jgi:hypothetical protein
VVATHPARFWLGMALAIVPIVLGPLIRAFEGASRR